MNSLPQTKTCSGKYSCGETKSIEDFYIKRPKTGERQNICKECQKQHTLNRYADNKESWNKAVVNRRKSDPDKFRKYQKDYRLLNGDVIRSQERVRELSAERQKSRQDYRASHRDERIAYNREYRATHKVELTESGRRYYAANRELILENTKKARAAEPERFAATTRKWKLANPEAVNALTHKRRAKIKGNGGSWTAAEWKLLKARYDFRCLMCGEQKPLCFDHVVPVALGGPNIVFNGQPLCRRCNSIKHTEVLDLRIGSLYDQRTDLPVGIVS